jgi:hypothetical protein
MRRATFVLLVGVLVPALPAAAQPSASGTLGPGISTTTGDGAATEINASAGFEQLLDSGKVRLFYDFATGDFASEGDWRFLAHAAGASYRFDFGTGKRHRVYAGADGTLRRNGDSWSAADFNALGAFANVELHPGRATLRSGYRMDIRAFSQSPAMDQVQHTAFGSVLASFETRTTLVAEVTAGTKRYDAVSPMTEVVAMPVDPGDKLQRQGQGRGGLRNVALVPVEAPGSPGSTARQLTAYIRVAQSLATRTGLSVDLMRRRVFGEVPPSVVATPANFVDDGIYDDLFASHATRIGATLTTIWPRDVEVVATMAWLDKVYPSTYAFDDEGLPVPGLRRDDQITLGGVETRWPLWPSCTGPVSLDLIAAYDYTRHRSTSALYRYTSHGVRLAVGVGY